MTHLTDCMCMTSSRDTTVLDCVNPNGIETPEITCYTNRILFRNSDIRFRHGSLCEYFKGNFRFSSDHVLTSGSLDRQKANQTVSPPPSRSIYASRQIMEKTNR